MIEDPVSKRELEARLREIDRNLFLEKQLTLRGELVWCVVVTVSEDHPPLTILEWRDKDGRPIPELASGLIERVQQMERDPFVLAKKLRAANEARIKELDRRRDEAYEEIAQDMIPRIQGKKRPVFHSGVGLRMTRDKMRARGLRK